jgi:hypothetical protein
VYPQPEKGREGGSASCSPNWISSRCDCLSLAVWLPAQRGTNSMCQNTVPFPRIPWSRVILERLQYAQPVWNHNIQYRVRKSLSLPCVPVLNQMNPTHALQLCLPNIVVLWTYFLVRFPSFPIKIVYTFLISPICTCPAYPILLRLTNPIITGSPQIIELLIMNLLLPPIAPQKLHTPKQRRIVVCVLFFFLRIAVILVVVSCSVAGGNQRFRVTKPLPSGLMEATLSSETLITTCNTARTTSQPRRSQSSYPRRYNMSSLLLV